jgi:hypothetical protein
MIRAVVVMLMLSVAAWFAPAEAETYGDYVLQHHRYQSNKRVYVITNPSPRRHGWHYKDRRPISRQMCQSATSCAVARRGFP